MFRKGADGVTLTLDDPEVALLRQLFGQMVELLAIPDVPPDPDPLARLVGLDGPTEAPRDPALARLLPAGYRDDDEAAADFRRFTEPALRSSKSMNARIALAVLDDWSGEANLSSDQVNALLLGLNDMRLALGTRIGIGDSDDGEGDGEGADIDDEGFDDGDDPAFYLYDWLTYLQGTLVDAVSRPT